MNTGNKVLSAIELRWPVAIWVLVAHAYALLIPLILCVAVSRHWDYLAATIYRPDLLYVAAALLCAGSAFEVAQNASDRWYLTSDSPSANGAGFSDFLFYWLVTAGQALAAVAIAGDVWWVVLIAVGSTVVFPFCYLRQVAYFAPLSIAAFLTTFLAYTAFGDPVVFLQILLSAITIYFFNALLKTGAQAMHGFTTLTASSGTWFFVWALDSGANGTTHSWIFVLSIALTVLVAGTVLWPMLMKLPTSPRIVRDPTQTAVPA